MRRDGFGSPNFQPSDTLDDILEETGEDAFEYADYYEEPDENYGWNGELVGDAARVSFEGFDTKEAMMKWLTEEIGVSPRNIDQM